jgi:glutathione synthase/RimK-type ligase-like ATP-grasp enzyme
VVTTPRIALATCSALPDLDADDAPLIDALESRGFAASAAVWDAPGIDWSAFDLVVIRNTWDYTERPREFVAWARSVPNLMNPGEVVAWNIDKSYQRALERAGLPIVPTIWLDPERNFDSRAIHTRFPAFGDFVIKPTISAGSRDTGRYEADVTPSRALAITHAKNLLQAGRHVMIQRYLKQVDTAGEAALVFIDGQFSHAVRKDRLLEGPYRPTDDLYKVETMTAREATEAERDVAERVVAALPELVPGVDGPLLYTRVDLIPDNAGNPVVLELELTEPSLFLALAPGALDRFADAVAARVRV